MMRQRRRERVGIRAEADPPRQSQSAGREGAPCPNCGTQAICLLVRRHACDGAGGRRDTLWRGRQASNDGPCPARPTLWFDEREVPSGTAAGVAPPRRTSDAVHLRRRALASTPSGASKLPVHAPNILRSCREMNLVEAGITERILKFAERFNYTYRSIRIGMARPD